MQPELRLHISSCRYMSGLYLMYNQHTARLSTLAWGLIHREVLIPT